MIGCDQPVPAVKLTVSHTLLSPQVFWEGKKLGAPSGVATKAINYLTLGVLNHFISRARFDKAEEFFSKFRPMNPEIAALIARAIRQNPSGDFQRGLALLATSIRRAAKQGRASQLLLIEESQLLLLLGEDQTAVFVAEGAHACGGSYGVDAAYNLADVYAEVGNAEMAFAVLNSGTLERHVARTRAASSSNNTNSEWGLVYVTQRPSSKATGQHKRTSSDGVRKRLGTQSSPPRQRRQDRKSAASTSSGSVTPSEVTSLTRFDLDFGHKHERACDVVFKISRKIGWQKLVQCRENLFSAGTTKATAASADAAADRDSAALKSDEAGGAQSAEMHVTPRACARWLDELLTWLNLGFSVLAHWRQVAQEPQGAVGGGSVESAETSTSTWESAALLALTLRSESTARLFLARCQDDSEMAAVVLVLLLTRLAVQTDLTRALQMLSKLVQVRM
jgi:hypothetical protein